MRKSVFYPRLAAQNIRRNRQFYLPFILTCVATTAMFYIMCFLAYNPATEGLHEALYFIMQLGCVVIGVFSAIFLFYTNSFLMKRRQKELGLYNILGMGKGNIAAVLFFETIYVTRINLVCGIALGILLSKLTLLLLCKLIAFSVPYGFEISVKGILYSVYLFCGIFLAILISNLIRIKLSKPIELLRGGNVGEKEPKTKWVLAVLGILALGAGYWIAIVTEAPLQAILLFFVAVLLVIAGTYLLFTASSIAILKRLRSKPNYYYTTRHFIPVSGMIYRMKQNAVGLANICILATMVLVMVSGTVCLYLGTEDALKSSFPTDMIINIYKPTGTARDDIRSAIDKSVSESGLKMSGVTDFYSLSFSSQLENGDFGKSPHLYVDHYDNSDVYLLSDTEYGRMTGETVTLNTDEALVYDEKSMLDSSFSMFGKDYKIEKKLDSFPDISKVATIIPYRFVFVISDDTFTQIVSSQTEVEPEWYYGFDLDGTSDQKIACCDALEKVLGSAVITSGSTDGYHIASYDTGKTDVYAMNGGFLFLGLFLGLIFLIATVLIIYYKQLSEGYDDKDRFEIMQKVGLSRPEIKKAIRSQVLVVFFLPLCMAVIHIAFAFKMITKLLLVMNLTNVTLFAICTLATVAVFALIYGVVYMLTAKIYYRIVS
ncbi:MAG: ABC transporter permease [Oscillospiraceae bacterium]